MRSHSSWKSQNTMQPCFFFFLLTLVTGPRRFLSLNNSALRASARHRGADDQQHAWHNMARKLENVSRVRPSRNPFAFKCEAPGAGCGSRWSRYLSKEVFSAGQPSTFNTNHASLFGDWSRWVGVSQSLTEKKKGISFLLIKMTFKWSLREVP